MPFGEPQVRASQRGRVAGPVEETQRGVERIARVGRAAAPGRHVGEREGGRRVVGQHRARVAQQVGGLGQRADGSRLRRRGHEQHAGLLDPAGRPQVRGRLADAVRGAGQVVRRLGVPLGALRGGQVGVEGVAQQRVPEPHPVAGALDQALVLGRRQRIGEHHLRAFGELGQGHVPAGDRERPEQLAGVRAQPGEGGAHRSAQPDRHRLAGGERAGRLDREQRVAVRGA